MADRAKNKEKPTKEKRQKVSKSSSQRHAELKKHSLQQPGIKELMIAYDHWKVSHKSERVYQEVKELNYNTVNSNSSNPKLKQIKKEVLYV